MTIAAALIAGLLLQAGTATRPAPLRLPGECPRLLLTWHPGMPLPTTPPAEAAPTVVAAVWDSGIMLRAESIDLPHGAHVIGTMTAKQRDALLQDVSASTFWSQPEILIPDAPSLTLAWNRGSDVVRHAESPAATGKPTALETLRERAFGLRLLRVQRLAEPIAVNRWRCPPEIPVRR